MTERPERHRHVIIGGSNKCGTTSLFRYLGQHPEVLLCSRKELGFFNRQPGAAGVGYAEYLANFPDDRGSKYLLEATPTYLDGGTTIARRIRDLLGSPRLIFMLRDPTSRLISYYRSKHGMQTSAVAGVSLDEFLETALREAPEIDPDSPERGRHGWQLVKAHYGHFLLKWLDVFDAADIHIALFDDFRTSPLGVTKSACDFLDIDASVFDTYNFSVENRSRIHRSSALRTLASRTNELAEPLLNRFPGIRNALRAGYNSLNVEASPVLHAGQEQAARLDAYFAACNRQTAEVLTTRFGLSELPAWLR